MSCFSPFGRVERVWEASVALEQSHQGLEREGRVVSSSVIKTSRFNGFKEPGLLGRGVGGGNQPHSVSINNKNRAGREKKQIVPVANCGFW